MVCAEFQPSALRLGEPVCDWRKFRLGKSATAERSWFFSFVVLTKSKKKSSS